MFLLKKHPILVQKIGYGVGEYLRPPVYGFSFSEKGVTDLGGTPPITDKIRKVVFDPLPYILSSAVLLVDFLWRWLCWQERNPRECIQLLCSLVVLVVKVVVKDVIIS